jgi:hypothetical protein
MQGNKEAASMANENPTTYSVRLPGVDHTELSASNTIRVVKAEPYAMGEMITLEGFDRDELVDYIRDNWSDDDMAWFRDAVESIVEQAAPYWSAKAAEAEAPCTCHYEDTGNGESGPHLSMTPDEACPSHGREAMPEPWAEMDGWERSYALSEISSLVTHKSAGALSGEAVSENEDLVMSLYAMALDAVEQELPDDDGHNCDRAMGNVADALLALYGIK